MDLPFLSKILNSEWRQRTSKRYPVLVANLEMSQSDVDVNLAPDKRSVLVKNRKYCEFRFKNVLESTWSGLEGGSSHEIVSLSQPPIDKFINNQKAERKSPEKSILEPESTDKENHNSEDTEFDGLVCTILTPGPREQDARTLDKPDKEKSIQKPIDDFLHDMAQVDSPIKISKQTEKRSEQNFNSQKTKNIEDAKYFIKFEARESNRDSEHDSDEMEIDSNEQKSLNEESSRDLFKSESLSDGEESQKSFEISGEKPEEGVKEEFIDTQQTPNVENLQLETEYRSPLIEILTPNKSRSRNNITSPTHKKPRLDPRLDESAPFEPSGNPIGESTHLQESTQLPEPKGTYNFSMEKLKSFHQRQSSKLRRVFKMLLRATNHHITQTPLNSRVWKQNKNLKTLKQLF